MTQKELLFICLLKHKISSQAFLCNIAIRSSRSFFTRILVKELPVSHAFENKISQEIFVIENLLAMYYTHTFNCLQKYPNLSFYKNFPNKNPNTVLSKQKNKFHKNVFGNAFFSCLFNVFSKSLFNASTCS